MGNANSASEDGTTEKELPVRHARSRPPLTREQLRAKSFLKREEAGLSMEGDVPWDTKPQEEENNQAAYVEKLEADIQRLADKCAALESQNILVAVQQLDIFARYSSALLAFLLAIVYLKIVIWSTSTTGNLFAPEVIHAVFPTELFQWTEQLDQHLAQVFNVDKVLTLALQATIGKLNSAWSLRFLLVLLPILYNHSTHGSLRRRFQVFIVAFIIIARIRMCRWRESFFLQADATDGVSKFGESCTNDGIWEANYEISARFLYLSILRLRGLWTKTAQYLSSRADFVPAGYIRELSKLQDQAPATPWEVASQFLPPHLLDALTDIETTPLASASIGQVHAARLKATGEKVVIKVQHPHARSLLTDDFLSLRVLTKVIAWMEPDYAFMEILMREWATEARKELDFRHEAQHLLEANDALKALHPTKDHVLYSNVDGVPFQVQVPMPIQELSNSNVLVMTFCEGCRVDNFSQIEADGLSREAVMDGIAQAFAHFMYCSTIFNADPHPGNLLVRPGTATDPTQGFTVGLLDWGLAKRLPEQKRLAFCQMVYAAATFDYGLLLDSYRTVGLKMKREDSGQSMEDMRFFLRDMAPREAARQKIKSKIKRGEAQRKKSNEKVPMESKAYPGEFFFFIRVNELLHGLGSRFSVSLGYLDALRPYAEKGLRQSQFYNLDLDHEGTPDFADLSLQRKLERTFKALKGKNELVGGQVCILDKNGTTQANVAHGDLGGLRSNIPMQRNVLILGYSTTKAVTATLAHILVQEGYLSYDEPICERVWKKFCPTTEPPHGLDRALGLPCDEVAQRWQWKRQVTLRHILSHSAGLWSAFPTKLTIQMMASCEKCSAGYEYNSDAPSETVLPTRQPGELSEYHFMSFGWLVAGTLCGAYAARHGMQEEIVTLEDVFKAHLEPRLSESTKKLGFRPLGGAGDHVLSQTVTSDVRASELMQRRREMELPSEEEASTSKNIPSSTILETFQGKEFLLDPRIWNSQDALDANVPAAGGRFSAAGLAHFYHDLSNGKLLQGDIFDDIASKHATETTITALQGVTRMTNDSANHHTKMGLGYQLIRTDRDGEDAFSGVGHAGVGGSIGFVHRPTGLCIGLMLNKADGGQDVTMSILRVIGEHFKI